MDTLHVKTNKRIDFVDVTNDIKSLVNNSSVESGILTVYVPHTTCGIIINEHADPDVIRDIHHQLEKIVPYQKGYQHLEGNADSHIKTALVGSSEQIIIENGTLILGTWQGIFLCDFDGPRTRKIHVKITADK
jgi:secondary thiamine-phosphate synthase enzyme